MNSQFVFDYLWKCRDDKSLLNDTKTIKDMVDYTMITNDDLSYHNMGYMYDCGIGVEENRDKAVEYYIKAAELCNKFAMNNLGCLYENKLENYDKALEWYTKSAELGDLVAITNLGCLYEKKLKNYDKALEWYTKAAELDYSPAINGIGYLYYDYFNNNDKALEWYTKAAELGNLPSMYNIGLMCIETEKYEEALIWFQKVKDIDLGVNVLDKINLCLLRMKKLSKLFSDITEDNCVCCLETLMNTNKYIMILTCGHSFHYTCVKYCSKCPVCRDKINM